VPESKVHRYDSAYGVVTWDAVRCIHAAECVRGLPQVFDPKAKPWIAPEKSDADTIAAVIARCPSGALHLERRDGGAAEAPDRQNTATVTANGPNYLRGDLAIVADDGTVLAAETRIALCRCGGSQNKPLCDGTHRKNGFADAGRLPAAVAAPADANASGRVTVRAIANGPIKCVGPLTMRGTDAASAFADATVLCRCGHSANKPYCDATHKRIGFKS